MTLWVGTYEGELPSYQVWWPYPPWYWSYNEFSLLQDLARSRDQRVKWIYGWDLLKVNHHPAKFGGRNRCGSGDMFSVAEEEDSRCFRFNLPLLFISKGHGSTAHGLLPVRPKPLRRRKKRKTLAITLKVRQLQSVMR